MPFIGVYSTPKHPLALVFEFMDHLNLGEYLRNNEDIGRHELVHFYLASIPISTARHTNVLRLVVGNSTWCEIHA